MPAELAAYAVGLAGLPEQAQERPQRPLWAPHGDTAAAGLLGHRIGNIGGMSK